MKKFINRIPEWFPVACCAAIIIGLTAYAACAQLPSTNQAPHYRFILPAETLVNTPTYTNGTIAKVPLSDQQLKQLKYLMKQDGLANMPINQVLTNYMAVDFIPANKGRLQAHRAKILGQLQNLPDDQLDQVPNAISNLQ